MANNNTLKSDIRQYIYSNQNEEITGNILRDVLLEMVDTLGDGWTYKGVATTTTNPGTPDDNVFYIATAPGTYTNFGGLSVADGEVAILKYNGSWAKDVTGAATSAQVTQLGREIGVEVVGLAENDLAISDDIGFSIVEFRRGHIRTKYFDSSKVVQSTLNGKRVAFLGDSITEGSNANPTSKRYSSLFCSMAGCTEINLGVAGTCIANNTLNNKSSQRFITRATQANLGDADLIIVFGGTNDFSYDSKAIGDHFAEETIAGGTYIGTKKKVAPSDTDTFAGALHELILQIQSVAPSAKIVFVQPLNRGRYSSGRPTSYESNRNGNYLQDFRDAIRDICAFYSVPVVYMDVLLNQNWANDTSESLHSLDSDGLHPNNLGHEMIAKLLFSWVINNVNL